MTLGAWGCGVFGWKPETVAYLFKEKIKEGWYGGTIQFSIIDECTLEIFRKTFASPQLTKKIKP